MTRQWMRRAMGTVAALAVAAGCATAGPAGTEAGQEELDRARRLWETGGSDDYRYTLQRICFCVTDVTQPVEVEVRGGVATARRVVASGAPVSPEQAELWPTVEGLFDLVQEALDREADRVTVSYDPDRGFPTSIQIDYSLEMADEEQGFEVEAPVPLP